MTMEWCRHHPTLSGHAENTPLLLAFTNGGGHVCALLIPPPTFPSSGSALSFSRPHVCAPLAGPLGISGLRPTGGGPTPTCPTCRFHTYGGGRA